MTDVAGTTRDILKEYIQIDGMPLHIIDTAGLRDSQDKVEKEGIRRAYEQINKADIILLLIDVKDSETDNFNTKLPSEKPITKIYNKIDLLDIAPEIVESEHGTQIYLSIKTGSGMHLLKNYLKKCAGFNDSVENVFIARRRHLVALQNAQDFVANALVQLRNKAGELVAEDLRQAQLQLAEITGEFTSDDLLGKIFSSFCIGK